jgi:hypothetical protein
MFASLYTILNGYLSNHLSVHLSILVSILPTYFCLSAWSPLGLAVSIFASLSANLNGCLSKNLIVCPSSSHLYGHPYAFSFVCLLVHPLVWLSVCLLHCLFCLVVYHTICLSFRPYRCPYACQFVSLFTLWSGCQYVCLTVQYSE